jgi:dihydropteroate synthase
MTKVMGIVNVTPDSFSDGGEHLETATAVAYGLSLLDQGADVLDIGGESTRPGAQPVELRCELDRVVPVIEGLHRARPDAVLSVDTTKAEVAEAALRAGASIINDVSASLEQVAAAHGAGWVAMHTLGPSATMQDDPVYDDVVEEVATFLAEAADRGRKAGVTDLWVDPGIGFGKTFEHNLELLANVDRFRRCAPVLVGASRKQTIGVLHQLSDRTVRGDDVGPIPVNDRLEGSLAAATWSAFLGADMVRVHDVRATVHAVGVISR